MSNKPRFSLDFPQLEHSQARSVAGRNTLDIRLLWADANARGEMMRLELDEFGLDRSAFVNRVGTARVEATAAGRIDRRRHVALKHDAPASRFDCGIGNGHRRNECLC